jgi:probable rRNA maturation factor
MIYIDNESDLVLHVKLLEQITNTLTQKDVELLIIDSDTMHEINREHRGLDKTTDVLSFPLDDMPHTPIGSIVINKDLVKDKAKEFGHSEEEEATLLYIHGLLHILGFDHECDNGQMREKEAALIKEFKLPSSLIIRTGE